MAALARAGSELVRVTVNNEEAAAAVPRIVEELDKQGVRVPIIGDFHYNGHVLLTKYPECARDLAKYRINPGNASIGRTGDANFRTMIEVAVKNQKPVRIGVNWGSLDQALLTKHDGRKFDARRPERRPRSHYGSDGGERAEFRRSGEKYGLRPDQIILSAKVSGVQDLIDVYRALAARCNYPLHLGLTEAGMGAKGVVASSAAMGVVLQEGIGDTIRVSLTPAPERRPHGRSPRGPADSAVDGHSQLHAASDGLPRLRAHHQHLLPGNGASRFRLICASRCRAGKAATSASKR